jgi:hypothetical protein
MEDLEVEVEVEGMLSSFEQMNAAQLIQHQHIT